MVSPSRSSASRRRRDDAGKFFVGVLILLGLIASIFLVFSNSLQYVRVGLVAALWAAAIGALAATRYRRESSADRAKVHDLQTVYELQLEREVSARREYELGVESRVRHEVGADAAELAALRGELAVLRTNLQRLFDGDLPGQRPALHADATRVHELPGRSAAAANGSSSNAEWPTPVFEPGHPAPPSFATPYDEPVTAETATVPEEDPDRAPGWSGAFTEAPADLPHGSTVWSPPAQGAEQPKWPWEVKQPDEGADDVPGRRAPGPDDDADTGPQRAVPPRLSKPAGAAASGGSAAGARPSASKPGSPSPAGRTGSPSPASRPGFSAAAGRTGSPASTGKAAGSWPTADKAPSSRATGDRSADSRATADRSAGSRANAGDPVGAQASAGNPDREQAPAGPRLTSAPDPLSGANTGPVVNPARASVGTPTSAVSGSPAAPDAPAPATYGLPSTPPADPADPAATPGRAAGGAIGTPSARRRRRADTEEDPSTRRLSVAEIMANLQSEQKRGS
ncbi:DUF6779 domain-containing protein [Nocardia asteroides]|uniref:DUF6779 domain-containing protein n=1 Tax=Nocardia asteroides TaxID=1824 RepID=UPI001E5BD7E0|nr:DUF6779 domain-containing protein [Nocardia asteroides]UGT59588.1 hypothetical protein LTT61_20350 [Nocardia asteroides]